MSNELTITQKYIENKIFNIRGIQVMLDSDLADMYQTETRYINRAMKRNPERFPEVYAFQLKAEEWESLRFQIDTSNEGSSRFQSGTLNKSGTKRGYNIKYLPYAFTEQGVAMLSAVLRSDVAVKVSIQIMNAFIEMRKLIANYSGLLQRMDGIERKQIETDHKFEKVFKALEGNTIPTQGVFFDGQVFDAYKLASKIIRSAKQSIVLIDNYIDENTLTHLSKKKNGVKVLLLCKGISKALQLDIKKANEQYENFEVRTFNKSHDRFLIIDGKEIYHLGASLKDLGKKWFAFSVLEKESVESILKEIEK